MAWIESHQNLEEHPKILLLCQKTGWTLDEAIGKLHRLWWWTLKYAEEGDLSKYDPSQFLVRLTNVNGKITPKELYEVLQKTNFVEKNGLIHDWLDYAGRYLTTKYRTSNPNKLRMIEKKYKSVKSRTTVRLKSDTLPTIPTLPNQDNLTNSPQVPKIEDLLKQFNSTLQEKIKVYIERNRLKNKSRVITEGRKVTLITELWNAKERCADEQLFDYALDMAINYDACNVGYIGAIVKNKKAGKP